MQLRRTGLHPLARGVERVCVVDGLPVEVPLPGPPRLAVADVDGGQKDHAGTATLTKLLSSRRPSRLDFSGWNWTPKRLSFSMAVTNSSPYMAVPAITD